MTSRGFATSLSSASRCATGAPNKSVLLSGANANIVVVAAPTVSIATLLTGDVTTGFGSSSNSSSGSDSVVTSSRPSAVATLVQKAADIPVVDLSFQMNDEGPGTFNSH